MPKEGNEFKKLYENPYITQNDVEKLKFCTFQYFYRASFTFGLFLIFINRWLKNYTFRYFQNNSTRWRINLFLAAGVTKIMDIQTLKPLFLKEIAEEKLDKYYEL